MRDRRGEHKSNGLEKHKYPHHPSPRPHPILLSLVSLPPSTRPVTVCVPVYFYCITLRPPGQSDPNHVRLSGKVQHDIVDLVLRDIPIVAWYGLSVGSSGFSFFLNFCAFSFFVDVNITFCSLLCSWSMGFIYIWVY